MAEFSPPESAPVQFYDRWQEFPIRVIFKDFGIPMSIGLHLAADYAEHVLYIFEDKYLEEDDPAFRPSPRAGIEAVRKFASGNMEEIDFWTLESMRGNAKGWRRAYGAARMAARAVEDLLWAPERMPSLEAREARSADWAAKAAASRVSRSSGLPEWQRAYDIERAWQIRRFVDVMEAVGQDQDWPDLGATK